MAARYDFIIEQGATFYTTFVWKNQDNACCEGTPAAPAAVDLTDYTPRIQVRPSAGSGTLYFEANPTNGYLFVVTPETGTFGLSIPASVSTAWTWRRGVYDLEMTNTVSGVVTRLLEGTITVSPEVTV